MGKFNKAFASMTVALADLESHVRIRISDQEDSERRMTVHALEILISRTTAVLRRILEEIYDADEELKYKSVTFHPFQNNVPRASGGMNEFCALGIGTIMADSAFVATLKRLHPTIRENTRFVIDSDRDSLKIILASENVYLDLLPAGSAC